MDTDSYHLLLIPLFNSQQYFSQPACLVGCSVVLIILMIIAGMISGAESAFFTLTSKEQEEIDKESNYTSKLIVRLLGMPVRLFATIKTARLFANVVILALATMMMIHLFAANLWIIILGFFIVFGMLLLLEDRFFNVIGYKNALKYARFMAFPLYVLKTLLYPFYRILTISDSEINNRIIQNKYKFTIDELSDILDLNSVQSKDTALIKDIMKFGDTDVKEIMKSRVDVTAVEQNIGLDELREVIIESGYSRIPVYNESFDNITGILYVKDLLPFFTNGKKEIEWNKVIRPAFFVPESKKISELLKDFQINKVHLAIVNDEYGGTYGIVTLEDIIEEIVGEISDESDEEEFIYTKADENNYFFEGKILLNDLYRIIDISDETFDEVKGDSDTLAGLILDIKGEMPKMGEVIQYKNYQFKIESVDKRRIKQIKLTILPPENEEEHE